MTKPGTFVRAAALAILALTGATAPSLAGPEDIALMKSYIGEWRGRGTLVGAATESIVCRLSVSQGNADKVNYSGRCVLAGTTLSIAGTMAYIEASRRYEAAMTTNATFSGIAVGQKRGSRLVFNLRERDQDEEGKDLNISAQIHLEPEAIAVTFDIVYVESGDSLHAEVPFSR